MRWDMRVAVAGSVDAETLLGNGWEPFGMVEGTHHGQTRGIVAFRRPCEDDGSSPVHFSWQIAQTTIYAGRNPCEPDDGFPKGEAFPWREAPGLDGAWKLVTIENGRAWWQRLLVSG